MNAKEYLNIVEDMLSVITELCAIDCFIAVCDGTNYITTIQAKTFRLPFEDGAPLSKEGVAYRAFIHRKTVAEKFPKSVFGVAISAIATPIRLPDTGEVIGTVTLGLSREHEFTLNEFALKLQNSIELFSSSSEELLASTEESASSVSVLVNNLNTILEQLKELESIVAYIKEVADQTNLLGLNAAIESARAGEFGRGFSVVSNEIRKLATNSKESVRNVTNFVNRIQEQIRQFSCDITSYNDVVGQQTIAVESIANEAQRLTDLAVKLTDLSKDLV